MYRQRPRPTNQLNELFASYIASHRRRRSSPLTIKAVEHALTTAQRWLDSNHLDPGELALLECEGYFDELLERQAVSTVRRHLAYLRAAYRYGIRHGLVAHDPTAEVRLPRLPDLEPQIYDIDELSAIRRSIATAREQAAFYLLAFAGLRLVELAALPWADVNFAHQQLHVAGKGGKFRLVPLHPALQGVLLEHHQRRRHEHVLPGAHGRPLVPTSLGRDIRALVDRAGVTIDAPSHAFRRTIATTMYGQGVRTRVIERIMGWAPRLMYERHYLRIADDQMREAILTLFRGTSLCHPNFDDPTQPRLPGRSGATENRLSRIEPGA